MGGIILGALAGAGEAAQNIGSTLMKSELDRDARRESAQFESDLALQRAQTLEKFKMDLHNAPMNRLSERAKQFAGEEVPREAARATTLGGNIPLAEGEMGPKQEGFTGDIGIVQRAIAKMPDGADKQAAMAQLRRQISGEQSFEEGIVAGQTTKRTADEAMGAAVADAKTNDLPAYAAYEKEIGKPLREERKIDQAAARDEARFAAGTIAEERKAAADARKYEVDMKRLDLQAGNLDAQNRKIDALIEHWERGDDTKAAKADKEKSPERLYSIVNSMNQTIRGLTEGSKGNTPEEKAEWKKQMDTAVRVRSRAQELLDQNLSDRGAPSATPAPAPATQKPTGQRPPLSSFQR
jgi:hypothetical protein